ncbi:MAG TPA: prepilin-type N-terminal cleavage/methylation domain-containing protein [Planctomycetes bacterium]|nr:prepilin-type N-terminal cleavage/methylation domain-containing protein [Planctomycetota bacterium]
MQSNTRGFSLIELVVVISLLAILSGVIVPRVSNHVQMSRDARRLADIQRVRNAIEQYHMDKGEYPTPNPSPAFGGWDVSNDGGFIDVLTEEGYLEEMPEDPLNTPTYHYRYFVYEPGTYACEGKGEYYVLGIRNFESPEFAREHRGFFRCADRNWGEEFAFVTGPGASELN